MLTRIETATLIGVEGYVVTVETDLHNGMPGFNIVGLADTTIKESFQRIKPAILNSGYRFPTGKVTINLVPAGKPKEGSHFDLPIALGITTLDTGATADEKTAFFGELSLDGHVNHIRGALPLVMSARKAGIKNIVLPESNAEEAAILEDINIFPVENLKEAVDYLQGKFLLKKHIGKKTDSYHKSDDDFSQVIGQESVKRALTIGAAGKHGVLMVGGPGCGKTMMAKRIPTIMPALSYEERLEITRIYSVAGMLSEASPIIGERPFRCPHHTISPVGLIGGGRRPRPGELSLAHKGVLFLDELGEFDGRTIDSMRQPVEDGFVRINRNLEEIIFPSDIMIVIAANPCKCGYLWDTKKVCTCTQKQIETHRRKLTGPFSDRIDIHIKVAPVADSDIRKRAEIGGISSEQMRNIVETARAVQRERYRGFSFSCNGELNDKGTRAFCRLGRECEEFMTEAYEKFGLTMRAYVKILKISRTIADIEGSEEISKAHIAEALSYRADTGE